MPIYEYKCEDCGTVSDYLLPSSDNKYQLVCTKCGGTRLDKKISVSTFIKTSVRSQVKTCCGRDERCQTPPCSTGEKCRRQLKI